MSQKRAFVWDDKKEKAAEAVAKGEFTQDKISSSLGIGLATLKRWIATPEFKQKVDEIIQDIDISLKAERIKIAKKEIKRVIKRLEQNEDKPTSKDLVALLKYVGEEIGDYSESKTLKIVWDDSEKEDGTDTKDTV